MTPKKSTFIQYIGDAVAYYKRANGKTNKDLAIYLDVSESFIKQANSGYKAYSLTNLWRLSRYLNTDINSFFPPLNNFKQFQEIRSHATKKDYQIFLEELNEMEK